MQTVDEFLSNPAPRFEPPDDCRRQSLRSQNLRERIRLAMQKADDEEDQATLDDQGDVYLVNERPDAFEPR